MLKYVLSRSYTQQDIGVELINTDEIMNDMLWSCVYPGLTEEMLDCEKIEAFFDVNF